MARIRILILATFAASASFAQPSLFTNATGSPSYQNCAVVGNGTIDDTLNVQTCINNLPDYGVLVFETGTTMLVSGTIQIYGRYGIHIMGFSTFYGPSIGKAAPTFVWGGPAGGQVFDIQNSLGVTIQGIACFSDTNYKTGTGGANGCFNVDNTLSYGPISSNVTFDGVSVQGMEQNPNFRGITFALTSNANNENMSVRNSSVSCSYGAQLGQGIVVGPSQNAFKETFEHNHSITNCATGVYLAGGWASIEDNDFNQNTTTIYSGTSLSYGPVPIRRNDAENTTNFFRGNGAHISDNRIAACNPSSGSACIWNTGGGTVLLENNSIQGIGGSQVPVAEAPEAGGALISRGNTWSAPNGGGIPNATVFAGFQSFGYKWSSQLDGWSGGLPLSMSGGDGWSSNQVMPAMPSMFSIDVLPSQYVVLEDGGANSNPYVSPPAGYVDLIPRKGPQQPPCAYAGRMWIDTADPNNTHVMMCLAVSGTLTWKQIK